MTTRTVIIAKAPVAGFAKTRLIPALGADGAAALAQRMLEHAVKIALAAKLGPVELCVTPGPDNTAWKKLAMPPGLGWSSQEGGDLGQRMARAAQRTLDQGENILLVGTDCPELQAAHLAAAAAALTDHDACLIASADGGYVLLGLRRFDAAPFDNMAWSTSTVMAETLRRLAALGWRVKTLGELHDIDEATDLQWLPTSWAPQEINPTTNNPVNNDAA